MHAQCASMFHIDTRQMCPPEATKNCSSHGCTSVVLQSAAYLVHGGLIFFPSVRGCLTKVTPCCAPSLPLMIKLCGRLTHRMAPPAEANARKQGYAPLRASSPPKDGSSSREYPLNRRVSPGPDQRRPAARPNPKGPGKPTIAPGQVPSIAFDSVICTPAMSHCAQACHGCLTAGLAFAASTWSTSQGQVCITSRGAR